MADKLLNSSGIAMDPSLSRTIKPIASNVAITSKFTSMKEDFNKCVEAEGKKYPLTSREQMFVHVINDILTSLTNMTGRGY